MPICTEGKGSGASVDNHTHGALVQTEDPNAVPKHVTWERERKTPFEPEVDKVLATAGYPVAAPR